MASTHVVHTYCHITIVVEMNLQLSDNANKQIGYNRISHREISHMPIGIANKSVGGIFLCNKQIALTLKC